MATANAPTAARLTRLRGARGARATPAARVGRARRTRVAYLDNLKALLVAVIVAAHGVAAYSDLESAWPYSGHAMGTRT